MAFFTESDPIIALAIYHAVRGILDARGVFHQPRKPVRVKRLKGEVPLPIDAATTPQ